MVMTRIKDLLLVASVVVCCSAPHFYVTRPCPSCSIPGRQYQYKKFSPTVASLSSAAIAQIDLVPPKRLVPGSNWEIAGQTRVARNTKIFQFVKNPALRIQHCQISQIAVSIAQDGGWTINLLAEQNIPPAPLQVPQDVVSSQPIVPFTEHLLRNEFYVTFRFFGHFDAVDPTEMLGKQVVTELEIPAFWVQKGVPYQLLRHGFNPQLGDHFTSIDRVEVNFRYRVE